jgi:ribulose-bisphosphate carboxylase large chain
MNDRLIATYLIRAQASEIEARAQSIAVEQSVEMPLDAIADDWVLDNTVGKVVDVAQTAPGLFTVRIALATATTGAEAGQLINMLYGNSSIHDDVVLVDANLPPDLIAAFDGPAVGLAGLRARTGAKGRALTCSALKPQGLPPDRLGDLAYRLALGGLDFIKDVHGLADQQYSPFTQRMTACAEAIARANAETGGNTRYVPSVTGNLDQLRNRVAAAREEGVDTVLIAPMIAGLPTLTALRQDFPDVAIFAHPALAGAARLAPPLLLGKLFRLFGADATIFPNHGGRFGYSPETCRRLADAARAPWHDIPACLPVPAGGMTTARVDEMLDFYGPDVMLLIGGGLLAAGDAIPEHTRAFTQKVAAHVF